MTTSHTPEDRSVNSSLLKAHTPGPWAAVELPTAIAIKSHIGNVANIQRGSMREQQKANARLIAAAPELLDALKEVAEVFGKDWREGSTQRRLGDLARTAIAKAEGKA